MTASVPLVTTDPTAVLAAVEEDLRAGREVFCAMTWPASSFPALLHVRPAAGGWEVAFLTPEAGEPCTAMREVVARPRRRVREPGWTQVRALAGIHGVAPADLDLLRATLLAVGRLLPIAVRERLRGLAGWEVRVVGRGDAVALLCALTDGDLSALGSGS